MHSVIGQRLQSLALLSCFALSFGVLTPLHAARQDSQNTRPDDSARNKDQSSPTADQQKEDSSDRAVTQKIRKSIMADKSLSTYAHNVKIVAQNGKVTLRGPVRSDDEKTNVESKAAAIVGHDNVTSQLEVAPSKDGH